MSFLKGIRDTLRDEPERFMAFNSGVTVADEAHLDGAVDGTTQQCKAPHDFQIGEEAVVLEGHAGAHLFGTRHYDSESARHLLADDHLMNGESKSLMNVYLQDELVLVVLDEIV